MLAGRSLCAYLPAQGDFSICGETTNRVEAIAGAVELQPNLVVLEISVEDDLEVECSAYSFRSCRFFS
jgi:DNA-binding NarL/FixJ family response regulator